MDYLDLQDATIADSFDESDRASVKTWINNAYGLIMNGYEWTFTQGTDAVSVTSGSQTVGSLPSDLGVVLGLQRADGWPLRAVPEYKVFARNYIGTSNTTSGRPEAFTVWGGAIYVGPTSNETSTGYLLTYEKAVTALAADTDVPVVPVEHHLALVFGAKAVGTKLKSVLLADPFEQEFRSQIDTMSRKYLVAIRGALVQQPAYRPGAGSC